MRGRWIGYRELPGGCSITRAFRDTPETGWHVASAATRSLRPRRARARGAPLPELADWAFAVYPLPGTGAWRPSSGQGMTSSRGGPRSCSMPPPALQCDRRTCPVGRRSDQPAAQGRLASPARPRLTSSLAPYSLRAAGARIVHQYQVVAGHSWQGPSFDYAENLLSPAEA